MTLSFVNGGTAASLEATGLIETKWNRPSGKIGWCL